MGQWEAVVLLLLKSQHQQHLWLSYFWLSTATPLSMLGSQSQRPHWSSPKWPLSPPSTLAVYFAPQLPLGVISAFELLSSVPNSLAKSVAQRQYYFCNFEWTVLGKLVSAEICTSEQSIWLFFALWISSITRLLFLISEPLSEPSISEVTIGSLSFICAAKTSRTLQ